MGSGRRTQTLSEISPSSPNQSSGIANFRNLRKSHLGGVIFGCTNSTFKECLFKQLFGLPGQHFSYVKNIDPGLPLFLFNYSDRKLHGIFEAASSGQMNINPYGWTSEGKERTPYPAQVQIHVRLQSKPLLEDQFKPIIGDNYYSQTHLWFELDHAQTNKLVSLLSSQVVAPSTSAPQHTTTWRTMFQASPSPQRRELSEVFEPPVSEVDSAHPYKSNEKLATLDIVPNFNGNSQSLETHLDIIGVAEEEKDLIYKKLKELALNREYLDSSLMGCIEDNAGVEDTAVVHDVNMEKKGILERQTIPEENVEGIPVSTSDIHSSAIAQLIQEVAELKAFKAEQIQKMTSLEHKLAKAETEIQQLKYGGAVIESGSNSSVEPVGGTIIESSNEFHLDLDDLIFLVGGYDGTIWSSALDSYSPSQDKIKSLQPMNYDRSYASVAKLRGELFVFGGGNGSLWYDTVESYDAADNQWTLRPSLNEKKGSLAGATLNCKLFALGGGNGLECFSNVEMLDLDVGRWISTRSMLKKRFALAAAELNGALYAVGGYDGKDYLNSAERFDPREHSWTRIENMNTKRGCHSLTVMNEKLYVVGGFDGSTTISTVEIYDPRLGSWMTGEPMNQPRGYSAAAVLKESMYIIGGFINGEDVIDTVECYKEGHGWQVTNLKAIGRRCFASAIVL